MRLGHQLPSSLVYNLCFCIILWLASCNIKEENTALKTVRSPQERLALWWQLLDNTKPLIRDGDLITRSGGDIISGTFANFNHQDKTYSHAGLAFNEGGDIYVYHALAGDENPTEQLLREPLDSFCDPAKKNGFGVFRYALDDGERSLLHAIIKDYYNQKIMFDNKFNLRDSTKMYCAEVVLKALRKSTQNRIDLPTTNMVNFRVKFDGHQQKNIKHLEYVAIDNLYLNRYCKEIARIKFE